MRPDINPRILALAVAAKADVHRALAQAIAAKEEVDRDIRRLESLLRLQGRRP